MAHGSGQEYTYSIKPSVEGDHQEPSEHGKAVASVTVIMPVKDEEEGLRLLVSEFRASPLAERKDLSFIIVVDGRSSDMSREVSETLTDSVIDQSERHGKGDAIKAAISKWSENPTELLVMMDADGSYQWKDVENVIAALESGAEAVTGVRLRGAFTRVEGMSLLHHMGNHALAISASIRNRRKIQDLCSGLWGFTREAITKIAPTAQGFDLEAELHGRVRLEGIPLVQIPIDWRCRVGGTSKLRSFVDGFRILVRVIRT